jgi:hypothetical protein
MQQLSSSYWERKEGKYGGIPLLGVIIAGLAWGASLILPFIITLLQNTITAVLLGVVLYALIYILRDQRLQKVIAFLYIKFTQAIVRQFVQIDPIGIAKAYIADLRGKLRDILEQIAVLKGAIKKIEGTMETNSKEATEKLAILKYAKDKGDQDTAKFTANKIGRRENLNADLKEVHTKLSFLYNKLMEIQKHANNYIDDMEDQIKIQEIKFNSINAASKVISSAKAIFMGNTVASEIYDMAQDAIANQIGMQLGEIENFLDISKDITSSMDLANLAFEARGFERLEQWELKNADIAPVKAIASSGKAKLQVTDKNWDDI